MPFGAIRAPCSVFPSIAGRPRSPRISAARQRGAPHGDPPSRHRSEGYPPHLARLGHHRARMLAILAPLIAGKATVLLVALLSPHCGLAQLFDALRSGQSTSSRVLTLILGATATVAAISCWVALEQRSFIPARRLSDLAAVAAGRHLRTRYPDWGEFAVHRHWRSQCTKPCGKRFSLCRANRPETLTVAPFGRYHSLQPAPTSAR